MNNGWNRMEVNKFDVFVNIGHFTDIKLNRLNIKNFILILLILFINLITLNKINLNQNFLK